MLSAASRIGGLDIKNQRCQQTEIYRGVAAQKNP